MRRTAFALLFAGVLLPVFLALGQEAEEPASAPAPRDCRACHSRPDVGDQWGVWSASAHAKAYEVLGGEAAAAVAKRAGVEGDPREAKACLSCHAPVADRREAGVSCEACHGLGDRYGGVCGESFAEAVGKGLRLAGEKQCLTCHRESAAHPDSDFVFMLDYDEIAHPRPAKDRESELFATEGLYTKWDVYTEKDGLPHHIVFSVTPAGDDVWFGTEDGVARLRGGKFMSWHVEDGLPHQAVTQVAVDPANGEVWASTLGGVARFDGESWTPFTQENSGLRNNCDFGIAIHGDDVWVASFDGIARYDRKTKEWKAYYLDNAPLEEVWIYGLESWAGGVNFAVWGGGLVQYEPDRDYWEAHHDPDGSFEMDLIQNDGPISMMLTSVSRDNGWTWAASYFGMSAYDGRNWIEADMDTSGMASNFVNFAKARRFEGWFATDRGLTCLDLKRDRWVSYRKTDGPGDWCDVTISSRDGKRKRTIRLPGSFPFNFVWGIGFQGEDIWVTTSDGVARGRY